MSFRQQRGLTLLEMMLVIGLLSVGMLLSFYSKQAELEQLKAQTLGAQLFQYNNAVRNYLANNNSIGAGTRTGTAWLKNTSCGGTLAMGAEYLPCSFPAASSVSPIKPGFVSLSTSIQVTGVAPNRKITATSVTSPFKMLNAGVLQVRSDLAGLAAITAAAGHLPGSTGSGFTTTTDASFSSNPLDATITMLASNNATQDVWLRTDGGNSMHAPLTFDSSDSNNRQIVGASRIQNLAAEALYLGRNSGVAAISGAGVVIDTNTEIIGQLRVRNNLIVDNGANVAGSVVASANLHAGGNVTATSNIAAGGGVSAATTVSAGTNVSAGSALLGQIFYDSNNTGYYVDPSATSNVNALVAQSVNAQSVAAQNVTSRGRLSANEYVEIGGVAVEGAGCAPNGLLGRNASGMAISCKDGVWASSKPVFTDYRAGSCQSGGGWNANYCFMADSTWATCNMRGGAGIGLEESGYIYRDGAGNWYFVAVRASWPGVFYWHCQR